MKEIVRYYTLYIHGRPKFSRIVFIQLMELQYKQSLICRLHISLLSSLLDKLHNYLNPLEPPMLATLFNPAASPALKTKPKNILFARVYFYASVYAM